MATRSMMSNSETAFCEWSRDLSRHIRVNHNVSQTIVHIQCSKLLPVRLPESDNFEGGPGIF